MSAPLVFAAPYVPPAPPVSPFRGLGMTWTGWDGTTWDLTNADKGVFIEANRGFRGLHMPDHTRWTRSAPFVPGVTHKGHQVRERSVFWPLAIYSDTSSEEWMARERALFKTFHPDRDGTWTVTLPDGERRYLKLKFLDDGSPAWSRDQMLQAWDRHAITLVADYPYWRGPTETMAFAEPDPVDFINPSDPAIITISSAGSFASASISNPGDIDKEPTWWLHGPFATAQVGVGGRIVDVPFAVADGKTLVIDTRPTHRTAKLINSPQTVDLAGTPVPLVDQEAEVEELLKAAVNKTKDLGATTNMNGVVPAGKSQPISIAMSGSGEVRILLTPAYRRAY